MRLIIVMAVVAVLLLARAFGQDLLDDVVREPHSVVGKDDALPDRYTQTSAINEILVTADNQILFELATEDVSSPNPFDLNERTVVFTPDGMGRYSREVTALEWEEAIGEAIYKYRPVIMLESFDFPFADQRWDSFYLGPPGVLTFGGPFTYSGPTRNTTMQEAASEFISGPTISALYKPGQYGTQHVARRTDRVVITWITRDSASVHGVPPEKLARFQSVLGADGSIRFNYIDVPYEDGIVGLFQGAGTTQADDLSQSESPVATRHNEVFHYSDITISMSEIACRLIEFLGEEFDLFVFHREFRMDTAWPSTAWRVWNFNQQGSGITFDKSVPCGEGRLKGHWYVPVWMKSSSVFDGNPFLKESERFYAGSRLFAHEFAHAWLAYMYYDESGKREPLHDIDFCHCHWRWDLHTPAAFPWRPEEIGPSSIMGGNFWSDEENGRFEPQGDYAGGGFSWLDLYGMGLADAEEVPDMIIARHTFYGTGEKEIISIDRIVAAEGPRIPGTAHSQKEFNAGFVYLLMPGQSPSGDLLELHLKHKDKAIEYWSHITGGRSRITTVVPRRANNRPPRAVGTIETQVLAEGGTAVDMDVGGYFSDPDGDPLTYQVASSDEEVARAGMSGSMVKIEPGSAGQATVTVMAKDERGGLAYQTIVIVVDAEPEGNPADFTFVPVILKAEGRNDSSFTSELTLTNRGTELATLDFTYTPHIGGGRGTVREYVEPGRQWIVHDAVEFLRERGVPISDTGDRVGTLRVASSRLGSSDIGVTVRTTTAVPEGRAGLAYPGVPVEAGFEEAAYVCGLRQNRQDRSNVALQHMGTPADGPITLRATVYSGDAETSEGQVLEDRILVPGGFYQYNGILSETGFDNGYVRVERVEGTAPFYAYGVINDQVNSDGSFVFPVPATSLRYILPVIVETGSFTSELTVTNFSAESKTVLFRFVADGIQTDDHTATLSLSLEAGEQRIIPDIIDTELRRKGVVGVGSKRGELAGVLLASIRGNNPSGIVVGARTGSPDGSGGQYGVFYNAVPFGKTFSRAAWVDGMQQNRENRSNLALVNTGEVDDSESVFHLEIYDGETGLVAGTVVTPPIPVRGWHQINGILGSHAPDTRQAYIRILRVSGQNPFLAYGVVNDGGRPGERSGDGAYVPARE